LSDVQAAWVAQRTHSRISQLALDAAAQDTLRSVIALSLALLDIVVFLPFAHPSSVCLQGTS
jgi:hypothetical protein